MACGPLPNVLLNQKYDLLGVVGHGQYGTAHKAKSRADGQMVCLKRIPLNNRDDHKGALQEAQLLSSLDHPNIIHYYESFLDSEGALCIATTYCEEGDLFTRICKRKTEGKYFSEDEVMDTLIQVASALLYIHSKKILHRDLKTQNVFLKSNGIVMLGDFGICKVLEKTDAFATTVTGTPYYMAPEVCTNQPYTYKSDIWSLGCVLYELCTLTHAFAADSLLSLLYQIVRGSYPPVPADLFSSDMQQLVGQLLTHDAAQRPSLPQVLSLPYVQSHMARFNAEEKRRILCKQTSLNSTRRPRHTGPDPVATEDGGMSELSASCESTIPAGLTPKQRLAWKKEEERRRRELELQVASMNATRERQEVAKRKQSQLASSSLHGILPAAHGHAVTGQDRPGSPSRFQQQQQQHPGGFSPSNSRPASARAFDHGTGATALSGRIWSISTHNSNSGPCSSSSSPTKGVGSSEQGVRTVSPAAVPTPSAAKPGSLAGTWSAGGTVSASPSGSKTAYQQYEDRAVGGSTRKPGQGFFIYDENEDTPNMATMQQVPQVPLQAYSIQAGRPSTAAIHRDICELSLDSDSVLLGSVQQQRPLTAPTAAAGLHGQGSAADWFQQPSLPSAACGRARAESQADAAHRGGLLPAYPSCSHSPAVAAVAFASRPQRSVSEPTAALQQAALAAAGVSPAAAAAPAAYRFGLNTAERRAFSCGGGSAQHDAAHSAGSPTSSSSSAPSSCCGGTAPVVVKHSPLCLGKAGVVRFGVQSDAEPASVFDVVLGGYDSEEEHIAAAAATGSQQQHCTQQQSSSSPSSTRYAGVASNSGSGGQQASGPGGMTAAAGDDDEDEYADENFEEYSDNGFEDTEGMEGSVESLRDEVQQRSRIMQLVAEMSRSLSSISVSSDSSSMTSRDAALTKGPISSSSNTSSGCKDSFVSANSTPRSGTAPVPSPPAVQVKQHADLAACQATLRADFHAVYNYLLSVHQGAAGGASVRGDEVKEALLGMVGADKAKQEACFSLEQHVFRAVLAGQ